MLNVSLAHKCQVCETARFTPAKQNLTALLNSLPTESLSHICGFLRQSDVRRFTFVSRQIGIVCLEEQNKITMRVLDTNSLMHGGRFMAVHA